MFPHILIAFCLVFAAVSVRKPNSYATNESFSPPGSLALGAGLNEGMESRYVDGFATLTTGGDVIWGPGGAYPFPTTAQPVRVAAGGDAADTIAGLGAQVVLVQGLDATWREREEVLILAGASASAYTDMSFLRINRLIVVQTGGYGNTNEGAIAVENSTDTIATVEAGKGLSSSSVYTVPGDKRGFYLRSQVFLESSKVASIELFVRENSTVIEAPFTSPLVAVRLPSVSAEEANTNLSGAAALSPRADLWWRGTTTASTAEAFVNYDIALLDA